jgi:hypothetical protein
MAGDTIARLRQVTGWPAARIGLVVLWVLSALAWWTQPRHADIQQMRDDLASGRVAKVSFSAEVDDLLGAGIVPGAVP